jgi:hypothetical protein
VSDEDGGASVRTHYLQDSLAVRKVETVLANSKHGNGVALTRDSSMRGRHLWNRQQRRQRKGAFGDAGVFPEIVPAPEARFIPAFPE